MDVWERLCGSPAHPSDQSCFITICLCPRLLEWGRSLAPSSSSPPPGEAPPSISLLSCLSAELCCCSTAASSPSQQHQRSSQSPPPALLLPGAPEPTSGCRRETADRKPERGQSIFTSAGWEVGLVRVEGHQHARPGSTTTPPPTITDLIQDTPEQSSPSGRSGSLIRQADNPKQTPVI